MIHQRMSASSLQLSMHSELGLEQVCPGMQVCRRRDTDLLQVFVNQDLVVWRASFGKCVITLD